MEKGEVMRGILSMAAPWLLFDATALLVAFVITGGIMLLVPTLSWYMAFGLWTLSCIAGLCIPDEVMDHIWRRRSRNP